MFRSTLAAFLALSVMPAFADTEGSNPFECTAPITALQDSLKEFRVISAGQLSNRSVLTNGEITVFAHENVRVLGRDAAYLEMMRSGDVIRLTSYLRAPIDTVRADAMRATPNTTWVCAQNADCGGSIADVSMRVFSPRASESQIAAISCTYNAGMLGASPARFAR